MAEISVIIVTWNAEKFIKPCLDSVLSQKKTKLEVIIYDNGSKDSTLRILKSYADRIYLIEGKENKGFCFGNNQALEKASGEFILTLNSDIILRDNYMLGLVNFLKKNPEYGMVQGKFLRMDRKTIDGLGLHLSLLWRLFNIAEGKKDSPRFNKPREIFGPCAAAALYRKELIDDVTCDGEVFDEDFFFLVEDFDLAWRARQRGWKAMYFPGSVCYHYRESSAHKSGFRQYLSLRNRYYMIIKNADFNLSFVIKAIAAIFLYDVPRLIFILFTNKPALTCFNDLGKRYRKLLDKRRKIKDKNK